MTESKQEMWSAVQGMAKSCPIAEAAFVLLNEGMLEDQVHVLMRIVLMQKDQIDRMQKIQSNLLEKRYNRGAVHA